MIRGEAHFVAAVQGLVRSGTMQFWHSMVRTRMPLECYGMDGVLIVRLQIPAATRPPSVGPTMGTHA